jgi:hypothetical protein
MSPVFEKCPPQPFHHHPTLWLSQSNTSFPPRRSENDDFTGKIYFAKFDIANLPELSKELGIRTLPAFFFSKGGEKRDSVMGLDVQGLDDRLKRLIE